MRRLRRGWAGNGRRCQVPTMRVFADAAMRNLEELLKWTCPTGCRGGESCVASRAKTATAASPRTSPRENVATMLPLPDASRRTSPSEQPAATTLLLWFHTAQVRLAGCTAAASVSAKLLCCTEGSFPGPPPTKDALCSPSSPPTSKGRWSGTAVGAAMLGASVAGTAPPAKAMASPSHRGARHCSTRLTTALARFCPQAITATTRVSTGPLPDAPLPHKHTHSPWPVPCSV